MNARIQRWWDELVYRVSYKSINRHFGRNPGYAYLAELGFRRMRERSNMSDELKSATEQFFEAMESEKEKQFLRDCTRI